MAADTSKFEKIRDSLLSHAKEHEKNAKIVQAWMDGETLQTRSSDAEIWTDLPPLAEVEWVKFEFYFNRLQYRIAPEVRSAYAVEHASGLLANFCPYKNYCESIAKKIKGAKVVEFKEVIPA